MARRHATRTMNKKHLARNFPKRHVAMAGVLSVVVGIVAFAATDQDAQARRRAEPIELSLPSELPNAHTATQTGLAETTKIAPRLTTESSPKPAAAKPAKAKPAEPEPEWKTLVVRNGDSLSRLFQRVGLNDRDVYLVLKNCEQAADLKKLHPGEEIGFQLDNGELQAIRYRKSALEAVFIERTDDGYSSRKVQRVPEVRERYSHASIKDNLFLAGERAQLPHNIIMELANIFSGVIDFVYDPRAGDSFSVLYEELYLDGKKIDDGRILAASFTNRGTTYPAYHYKNTGGNGGYFNQDGVSMRKAFLRAPVDFTRISSNFNPRRLHPIYKTRRPHRGIDYAAARGTPVFATGEGRVVRAGYSRANGNFLVIKHGEAFVTKYLHLHKKQVKKGQRVKQGQIIGQVGSTGSATGPHLHYEFLLNGVHRNPRTIHKKLPKAESVAQAEMERFRTALQPLQEQFARYTGGTSGSIAMASAKIKNPASH